MHQQTEYPNEPTTTTVQAVRAVRVTSGVNAAAGCWLALAPWLLSDPGEALLASWVSVSCGCAIVVLALARVTWPTEGAALSIANALIGVLGAVLIWLFGDHGSPLGWNGMIVMCLVALLAVRSALITTASSPPAAGGRSLP